MFVGHNFFTFKFFLKMDVINVSPNGEHVGNSKVRRPRSAPTKPGSQLELDIPKITVDDALGIIEEQLNLMRLYIERLQVAQTTMESLPAYIKDSAEVMMGAPLSLNTTFKVVMNC